MEAGTKTSSTPHLRIENVGKKFAGLTALDGVSFTVERGGITALIGPNGAGKTTIINLITGVYQLTTGNISLDGKDLAGLSVRQIANTGLRRTFQAVHLFPGLSVMENLIVGQHSTMGLDILLPFSLSSRPARRRCMDTLDFLGLADKADLDASSLSYGDQRRVEIARALVSEPELLLLDEPAAGMNEAETAGLREDILRINEQGMTILLIEHDMSLVMSTARHVVVLDFGRKIADGTPHDVQNNQEVIRSYFGEGDDLIALA